MVGHRFALFFTLTSLFLFGAATAQEPGVATPNFIDQTYRLPQPDLAGRARIRFLTATDFPPFNFLDGRGRLIGLNVDLARALCEELNVTRICQIEARPFGELEAALLAGEADAVVAGLAVTPDSRARLAFSDAYLRFPARFVARAGEPLDTDLAAGLAGLEIGVVVGSAHEAMLRAFFPAAVPVAFDSRENALAGLRAGRVRAFFSDGVGLSFWLASEGADDCCVFAGGPYLSDRFLGEGLAIAVRPDDEALASAFDYALGRLVANGRMSELLLRYFPISAF